MDQIRIAVDLARAANPAPTKMLESADEAPGPGGTLVESGREPASAEIRSVTLNGDHLEGHRIISHNVADMRAKPYDMLRTQVMQTMDRRNWRVLAVTSPTAGCGKTVTAVNLALSIARQSEQSVLLVDMDFRRPQIANYLGLRTGVAVADVVEGATPVTTAVLEARVSRHAVLVLASDKAASAEYMKLKARSEFLRRLRETFPTHLIILDTPPMLTCDDVMALDGSLDCVLLVVADGQTRTSEIETCRNHLRSSEIAWLVLNKAAGRENLGYYY